MKWRSMVLAMFALIAASPPVAAAERGNPLDALTEAQKDALAARIAAGTPRKKRNAGPTWDPRSNSVLPVAQTAPFDRGVRERG